MLAEYLMTRFIWVMFLLVFVIGCAPHYESPHTAIQPGSVESDGAASTTNSFGNTERVLVYSARLHLETPQPDTLADQVIEVAQQFGGYLLEVKGRTTKIRVKAAHFKEAISAQESLGKLKHKVISGNDVTDQVRDLEIRLDNAKKSRDRYLELLKQATTVDEILKVERELERLNREIDMLASQTNKFTQQSDYSTITVVIQKEIKKGPLGFLLYLNYKIIEKLLVWTF